MSFAVEDFHDLVRLLQEHPEWRGDLRRLVLSEELLSLPESVQGLAEKIEALAEAQGRTEARLEALAEAQGRTEARLEALAEAQGRTEARLEALAEAQGRTEARLEALAEAQGRTEARLEALAGKIDQLVQVVSKLAGEQPGIKGFITESRYERKAHAYFAPIARRLRVLDPPNLDKLLDAAESTGALTEGEADEIRLADIVARGRRKETGSEVLLVVEAAWVVDKGDVTRATNRARLLARTGTETIPVVAGEAIESEAQQIAHDFGVWQVTNGSVISPEPEPR